MNRLLLLCYATRGSLFSSCYDHRYAARELLPNLFFKTLASKQLQMSIKNILESPSNIFTLIARVSISKTTAELGVPFNSSIPLCKAWCCQCYSKTFLANFILIEPFYNIVLVSFVVLKEKFRFRKEVYLTFIFKINNFTIKKVIKRFQVNIENIIKHIEHIYCCRSWFVDFL